MDYKDLRRNKNFDSRFSTFYFQKGFTFIDVLIGTFLMLVAFLGIFAAFQLGMKVVVQSKSRIEAIAIAKGEIEKIRNLPYQSIGVQGSFPDGELEPETNITRNQVNYKIERRVDFVLDSTDGLSSPEDECPNDYKKVEVKVSWQGRFPGEEKLVTDIAPKSLAQECEDVGGILAVSVFNALGQMINSPLIEIRNPDADEVLKTATPAKGEHYFALSPATYKVVVSKDGYSSERTYGSDEIAIPERPHPIVLEGQLTEISLSIDKVSSFSVDTLSPWGVAYFSDSFSDESQVAESSNLVVGGGEAVLAQVEGQYQSPGYLISITILPENLVEWDEFSFSDSTPDFTQIVYQILYFDGENWLLIPDSDLPGNSIGFEVSPVDLSVLDPILYPQIRLKAVLSTSDGTVSPVLNEWQLSWKNSEPTPIANATFHLQGEKIIGKDESEEPVYKYSEDWLSGFDGHIDILNLEWDSYTFSVDPASDLDLVSIDPSPQPIDLLPDTNVAVSLYLEAENSFLVTVRDSETQAAIFSADVRLFNTNLGYDETLYTDEKGQVLFIPLEEAIFNLEVGAPGYGDFSGTVNISGDIAEVVELERTE